MEHLMDEQAGMELSDGNVELVGLRNWLFRNQLLAGSGCHVAQLRISDYCFWTARQQGHAWR